MQKLHIIPRFDDSLTYIYAERVRVDRHAGSVGLWDSTGITEVPVAATRVIMLGPGSSITHEAIKTLADNNCLLIWCGEEMVRFYAQGIGGTRSAARLIRQARLVSDIETRARVVRRMYALRFDEIIADDATIEQIRGMEGNRVRRTYRELSERTGVPWEARSYERRDWGRADPINRAVSAANSCLYGLCHAAILSAGYSPALGFIHTGKQLSFVYDIADLYKTEVSLPVAFAITAEGSQDVERRARIAMRDAFRASRLIERVIPDIRVLLDDDLEDEDIDEYEDDPAKPGKLWGPEEGSDRSEE